MTMRGSGMALFFFLVGCGGAPKAPDPPPPATPSSEPAPPSTPAPSASPPPPEASAAPAPPVPAASASTTPSASAAPPATPAPPMKVGWMKDPYWYAKPGGLSLAAIKKAATPFFADIVKCADKYPDRGKHKLGMQLKIAPDGHVTYAYASGGIELGDCITAAAKKNWTFPKSAKESEPVFDLSTVQGD